MWRQIGTTKLSVRPEYWGRARGRCCLLRESALLSKCWKATSNPLLFLGSGQNAEPDFVLSADILSSSEALEPLPDRVRLGDFHGCGSNCHTRDARTLGAPNWLGLASPVTSGSAWDLGRCTDNCAEWYVHDANFGSLQGACVGSPLLQ